MSQFNPGFALGSGGVASGQLGPASVVSGVIASGAVTGRSGGGWSIASGTISLFDIAAGGIGSGNYASGSISANALASGAIGTLDIASGAVQSGDIASGSVLGRDAGGAFTIASGSIGTYDLSSGAVVRGAQFVSPIQSGTNWKLVTEETISGVRAVDISQSGNLRVAMASVSGRMPAMGIVWDNVLSGIQANVYTDGMLQFTSGMVDYSGYIGYNVYVGRSGHIVTRSGGVNSGGHLSGDYGQKLGEIFNSGGVVFRFNNTIWSGGPAGELTAGLLG